MATPSKKRRSITNGKVYINASFNNTIVTITDEAGDVLAWSSAGASGFKGSKKSTPYAAQVAAENAVEKVKIYGLEKVDVFVKGVGTGREQSIRALVANGLDIESISDQTPVAHNGCRRPRPRKV
ncbi:30S ribosomal protein S11 [Candidatus Peregrinibacteria bacterium CG22_combo_CG10-13_8_21_14_all_44_10]|nr:MAG: 30S ribosomal protein S11 [Candidatus Peregrinibacteria bacterium CG2_30_44_17]PIP66075.1 MAG: 30S ribosomal protein S11 [Candidatus Peregrinibacteria bacterium CG22_combo_CG10-13_8_21_14_all_44_10]PIS03609.1 MAG: 30S ribosomal protein S11 [Candidatus Peregrinibacteria bacterium CG10_big_fil_rev_8_21_14_0_10_44_7]PIX78871.1 MAG: 30S ribosomal protein S11 [Candidatus Peregrinibacteria bacterium CG_4_10_14_3_um_filter_44_21]PJB88878.1 MAG: 30S ribosomal protein S11 [Candidatus Peregriniba